MAYGKYKRPDPVVQAGFTPKFPASKEQQEIFNSWKEAGNIYCDAKAGSGKSTTLVWAMSLVQKTGGMLAFAKDIIKAIQPNCAPWITVKTAHSFGYAALAKQFGRLTVDDKGTKVKAILKTYDWLNPDKASEVDFQDVLYLLSEVTRLVRLMKLTMTHESDSFGIAGLIQRYNLEITNIQDVIEIMEDVFAKIISMPTYVDFEDMMWLPIRLNLDIQKYDLLYCDEVQDFSNLMICYVDKMIGEKAMFVGDRRQAIYGFAGSNAKSIDTLNAKFNNIQLPLNTCYRCDKSIIELAQTIVPEITAFEGNGKGSVNRLDNLDLDMPDGSMILCRRNAPLIRPCFQLLKEGRKAIIKGRDIGENITRMIDKTKKKDLVAMLDAVESQSEEQIAKLSARKSVPTSQIDMIRDQKDAIFALSDNCSTVDEVKEKIAKIFSEDTKGVTLSSAHRSKGLEADQVTIIDYANIRLSTDRMTPEDHEQERNLQYVAITRAKHKLDLIGC